ncbi:CdaR family protein [Desulfoscipio geothermicus]|uniref:YbbR domain-containing protein n=1 Tax=Desulfoscipio geothermicus DSM 3669 TaxID=1121426 RepID=A0A1I6DIF2_9FIRM|nr:CdaR family protein [Desulfoscipio geothermicus]SFR05216.1 YbbR domain-containing protein [Desulfoscipio geothermicus DSM 3669]
MSLQWRDNSLKIIAVLLAVLLWVYVTNEQNPVTNQIYSIPLTLQDEPAGYVVNGVPRMVSIRVKAPRSIISTLGKEDFRARLSLFGITAGDQELAVQVTAPPGVDVLQVIPETVRVQADKIVNKNVPVVAHLKGNPAEGLQPGAAVLKPPVVAVQGPSKVLEKINQLGVTVDVTGATDTLEREVVVETGIEGVTANPGRVTVTVPVTALPARDLPVRIRLTGEPAAGYVVSGISAQPSSVQVVARENVLHNLIAVSTMAVDITGITSNVEREVVLILPDGAVSVRPDRVQIKVQITRLETGQPQDDGEGADNPTQ